jgi:hypothetical protein
VRLSYLATGFFVVFFCCYMFAVSYHYNYLVASSRFNVKNMSRAYEMGCNVAFKDKAFENALHCRNLSSQFENTLSQANFSK